MVSGKLDNLKWRAHFQRAFASGHHTHKSIADADGLFASHDCSERYGASSTRRIVSSMCAQPARRSPCSSAYEMPSNALGERAICAAEKRQQRPLLGATAAAGVVELLAPAPKDDVVAGAPRWARFIGL